MTLNIETQGYAGADLTASTGLFCYQDGTDAEKWKVLTDPTYNGSVGVLVDAPADDARGRWAVLGYARVKTGGALEPGDFVASNSSGQAVLAAGSAVIRGIYHPEKVGSAASTMRDAASGDIVRILLLPATDTGLIKTSYNEDFGSISANTTAELTQAVTGVETGDVVVVSAPSLESGLVATAYASAADEVTIRVANVTAGGIDPADQTFYVTVIKQ